MNEYTSKGGVTRAHSDNGNLRDDGERLFSYDYKNRLVAAFRKSDSAPIAQYLYLSDNRRTKKTVFSQVTPGVVEQETLFFYDGWQVCEEQSGAGATETTYVYNPVYIDEVCQIVRSGAHPLGAAALWTHQNARADVVAVSDASGVVVERRFFDDFGRGFDEAKQPVAGSAVGNPYGFQGRRLDSETGLYFFRNRYYSPETGRFLQRDPVWDAGNFGNQYSFVGNGPVSGRDALGLMDPNLRETQRRAIEDMNVDSQRAALRAAQRAGEEVPESVFDMLDEIEEVKGLLEADADLHPRMDKIRAELKDMHEFLDTFGDDPEFKRECKAMGRKIKQGQMEFDKLMKQSTEIEVKVNTLNKSIGETTARIEGGKSPIKNLRQWKSIKFLGTLGTVFSVVGALQLTRSTQKDMRFLAHLTRAMKRGDYKEVARISHNAKKADHIVNDMLRFSASAGGIGPSVHWRI